MATKFGSEIEYKIIKKSIREACCDGKTRREILRKFDIGEKKYYQIRNSLDFEDYKTKVHDGTRRRKLYERPKKLDARHKIKELGIIFWPIYIFATALRVVLKMTGVLNLSWWLVLSPLLAAMVAFVIASTSIFIVEISNSLRKKNNILLKIVLVLCGFVTVLISIRLIMLVFGGI